MLKHDIFETIEEYNPNKKHKLLTAFDGMIADILSNTKRNSIVTIIYYRWKTKHASCFYYTTLFYCTKNMRLNYAHYFILKI